MLYLYWPTQGFKGRTFELWVLNWQVFNFSVSSSSSSRRRRLALQSLGGGWVKYWIKCRKFRMHDVHQVEVPKEQIKIHTSPVQMCSDSVFSPQSFPKQGMWKWWKTFKNNIRLSLGDEQRRRRQHLQKKHTTLLSLPDNPTNMQSPEAAGKAMLWAKFNTKWRWTCENSATSLPSGPYLSVLRWHHSEQFVFWQMAEKAPSRKPTAFLNGLMSIPCLFLHSPVVLSILEKREGWKHAKASTRRFVTFEKKPSSFSCSGQGVVGLGCCFFSKQLSVWEVVWVWIFCVAVVG